MSRRLHRALGQLRDLSPPVTTKEAGGGDRSAAGESQSPQGFGETVTTVTTVVTTEFVAFPKISTCGHERSAFGGSASKTVGQVVTVVTARSHAGFRCHHHQSRQW